MNGRIARTAIVGFLMAVSLEAGAGLVGDGAAKTYGVTDYVHRPAEVSAASKIAIRLAPGGGFTARLTRK